MKIKKSTSGVSFDTLCIARNSPILYQDTVRASRHIWPIRTCIRALHRYRERLKLVRALDRLWILYLRTCSENDFGTFLGVNTYTELLFV